MTDTKMKDNSNPNKQHQKELGGKCNGRPPFQRNHKGHHDHQKKKDPEAIPILHIGPLNNFMKFKEALLKPHSRNMITWEV
jgi:hypothetical protein